MRRSAASETSGMTEAPTGVVYLDTNVFVHAVEGTAEAAAPARDLIAFLRERPAGCAVTSEITFAEVLAPPIRHDALKLDIKRRAYLDLLLWSKFITLVPVSREILIDTADLRVVTRLKLPDAIHLRSAIQARCRFFVSDDRDFARMPDGMRWMTCKNESVAALIRELS